MTPQSGDGPMNASCLAGRNQTAIHGTMKGVDENHGHGSDRAYWDAPRFRAKMVQENLIRAARRPYTILHSTQCFEFISGVVDMGAEGDAFRLPSASVGPIAADDVAKMLTKLARGPARNETVEIGGHDQFGLDEIARMHLTANQDTRQVITDDSARLLRRRTER